MTVADSDTGTTLVPLQGLDLSLTTSDSTGSWACLVCLCKQPSPSKEWSLSPCKFMKLENFFLRGLNLRLRSVPLPRQKVLAGILPRRFVVSSTESLCST